MIYWNFLKRVYTKESLEALILESCDLLIVEKTFKEYIIGFKLYKPSFNIYLVQLENGLDYGD